MNSVQKRILNYASILLAILLLAVSATISTNYVYAVSADERDATPISATYKTFKDGSKYSGVQIAPYFDVDKFATLNTENNGGTHIDGDGDIVFSNYVIFTINLNYDKNSKLIAGTGVKVSKDSCDFCDVNKANNYRFADRDSNNNTEKQISYGTICAVRTNPDGTVFKYAPIFSTGETYLSEQIFNADGNYSIVCFFETNKNGKYQNHIIEWSFKVRSYVYLIDAATELPIKESGASGSAVYMDSAARQNITVDVSINNKPLKTYTAAELEGKKVKFEQSGKYKFVVKNGDFICEVFYFTVDTESIDKKVFFNNLKKKIGDNTYEAEGWFSLQWNALDGNPVQSAMYINMVDLNNVRNETVNGKQRLYLGNQNTVRYTQGEKVEGVGTYLVRVQFKTASVDYYINVVAMDHPSYNYSKLSAARFNTFRTKWWQVYDDINDRYLCFDYDSEYERAYNAAMTVANSSVIEVAGKFYFNGQWYNDRIDLTSALNDYVFSYNLKTTYYDYNDYRDDEASLRTFSSASFDGTIYLNDQFQFMSIHPSEVDTVNLVDENTGTTYDVKFGVPIGEQNIPNGKYLVRETDKYGNKTEYIAIRDKSAPQVTVSVKDGIVNVQNGAVYDVENIEVSYFKDIFDDYAVLKVAHKDVVDYFIGDEYKGIIYTDSGTYVLDAYDRNDNTVSCTFVIA